MVDIRSKQNFLTLPTVNSLLYEVKNVNSFFLVNLLWQYASNKSTDIIGFKIYKANTNKPILNKSFVITQKILESKTRNKNILASSNILYNKSLFSQNSKVKFEVSNSEKHDKKEGSLAEYSFQNLGFVPVNSDPSKNSYRFVDRNIKFGESYIYYVTAVTSALKETSPNTILVPIEFILSPKEPDVFKASESDEGILLIFGTYEKDIAEFLILKKAADEKEFKILDRIEADSKFSFYTDINVLPKKTYTYRIFSRDIWGNMSLTSKEQTQVFSYVPKNTSLEYQPSIAIDSVSQGMRIKIKNESPKILNSVRIERKDNWRFEKKFEVKSFDGVPWANNHFFTNNEIEFIDKLAEPNRAYSYKITGFNKSGIPVSYFTSPIIKRGDSFQKDNSLNLKSVQPKMLSFNAEILNKNQKSPYLKCSWNIVGDWSYLIVREGLRKIKIDSFHKVVFLDGFEREKKYEIFVDLYNSTGTKVQEINAATIAL